MEKKEYERWRVDLKKDHKGNIAVEKLKKVFTCKITDEQAQVLNEGVLTGFSVAPEMYYLSEDLVKEDKKQGKGKKQDPPVE